MNKFNDLTKSERDSYLYKVIDSLNPEWNINQGTIKHPITNIKAEFNECSDKVSRLFIDYKYGVSVFETYVSEEVVISELVKIAALYTLQKSL